jgi:glycosyltransferase involved in cell wall biosynthesis
MELDISPVVPPDIGVVVTTYNKPDQLAQCLDSIPEGVEVVVSDDGTKPRLDDLVAGRVSHYHWQEDLGNRASTARNAGVTHITKPKVLFLDDDVELHPMALAAHSIALSMYDVSFGLLVRKKWEPYSDDRMAFYMKDTQVGWNWCWSGNLAVRKMAFEAVDGFDAETYNGGHGFEDIDFARQLMEMGFRFHFNRLAMAHHPSKQTFEQPNEAVLRNQERYEDKWGSTRVAPSGR